MNDPATAERQRGSGTVLIDLAAAMTLVGLALLASALTSIKFDWVFWWAGKLWGHKIIETMAGRSRWAARTGRWAESVARRFGGPAVFLAWFIPFLPGAVIASFVGDVGMRLRRYMLIDFAAAIVYRGIWMWAGYQVGEPAKDAVALIAKYSNYIAIATLVLVVVTSYRHAKRDAQAGPHAG